MRFHNVVKNVHTEQCFLSEMKNMDTSNMQQIAWCGLSFKWEHSLSKLIRRLENLRTTMKAMQLVISNKFMDCIYFCVLQSGPLRMNSCQLCALKTHSGSSKCSIYSVEASFGPVRASIFLKFNPFIFLHSLQQTAFAVPNPNLIMIVELFIQQI